MSCCGGPKTGKEFDFDEEGPSDEDMCRFGSEVKHCGSCRAEMYDSATVCPACGHAEVARASGGKKWLVVAALIVVVAMMAWFGAPLI